MASREDVLGAGVGDGSSVGVGWGLAVGSAGVLVGGGAVAGVVGNAAADRVVAVAGSEAYSMGAQAASPVKHRHTRAKAAKAKRVQRASPMEAERVWR
jgi:hypothetical protein